MDKKIRVLVLADSPTVATGFAQVSKNILQRLAKTGRYEIDVIGINFDGDSYDREKHPYNIYTPREEMYGRPRALRAFGGYDPKIKPPYDLFFTIQDSFVIEGLGLPIKFARQVKGLQEKIKLQADKEFRFKWIGYFPVDADLKENWVVDAISLVDYPVAYCEYGKAEMLKYDRPVEFEADIKDNGNDKPNIVKIKVSDLSSRLNVINHGVDLNVFKPLTKEERSEFRHEYFGDNVKDDTFLIVNISRNQPRKDIMRTLQVFAEFRKYETNSHLYLHMQEDDIGGSIKEMARHFGLTVGQEVSTPINFNSGSGYSIDTVNKLYNAADACMTTTLGEGWGFISTEAFAVRAPLVAPNITSFIDIFNCDVPMSKLNDWFYSEGYKTARAIPVLAGSTKSEWINLGISDNERYRPLTNVDDMVAKLRWVKDNPDKVKDIVENAYNWVQGLTWDNIVKKWDDLFTRAYNDLEQERNISFEGVTRNDPCPCNSGKKYKHCHGSKLVEK